MSDVVELSLDSVLVAEATGYVIVLPDVRPEIVEVAEQGPPGPPGPPGSGGAQTLSFPAAQTLSGHRMAVATPAGAVYADPATSGHADALLGLTIGAVVQGDTATILAAGEITEPSWAWTPGLPLYVIANGLLSHTPPASGWVQLAAVALTATRILLTPRQTILTA